MERRRCDGGALEEAERTRCWEQRSSERVLLSLRPIHGRKADPEATAADVDGVSERLISSGEGATDAAFGRRCDDDDNDDAGPSLKRPNVHALDPFEIEPPRSVKIFLKNQIFN